MKKLFLLVTIISVFSTACYNYDGPTRSKIERTSQAPPSTPPTKPYELPIQKELSGQDYLEKMAKDIKTKIPSAQVQILEDSIKVLFPKNIQYDPSSILPLMNINPQISKLAKLIRQYDKTQILVTGHTDKTGDERQNKKISNLRAEYIVALLNAYNVPVERLSSWGLGSIAPVSNQNTNINRRVEFIILSNLEDDEEL